LGKLAPMGALTLTAFVAGVAHVVSGPDHLAAVGPFSAGGRDGAWKVGFRWGLGHALGTLVVGLLALAARDLVPIDVVSTWSERLVGVVLIAVGVMAMRGILRTRVHTHSHSHDGVTHQHLHAHVGGDTAHAHAVPHAHGHSATSIGTLHGLAGGSHLLGAVPALGLATALEAGSYLLAFALGAVGAMTAWTAAIGAVSDRLKSPSGQAAYVLQWAFAVAAVAVGVAWLAWSL